MKAAFLARSYPVGLRYRVLFESQRPTQGEIIALTCKWTPHQPQRMSANELADYRAARSAFIAELMDVAEIVGRAAVLEG